jgi:two-component system, OmpR family, sensor histidine kinase KdpD
VSHDPERPDPDALLATLAEGETERARGRLKVFLGACAGVGKTYAMLEAAGERRRDGVGVLAGVVETHGRRDTEALLHGLDVLPRREIEHRGIVLAEFDLDGAIARRPALILVDELAHTNAPACRHDKRWQDVEELLAAGIDVFTTVNVQHLESVNDVVARITHVRVRETVPDRVVQEAAEVEMVDLPPDELLKRLEAGKVYVPDQIRRAQDSFFRRGNLIALRQLALRYTAEHVDDAMLTHRRAYAVRETWPVRERLLVGVGPAPSSQNLVRAAKRMADGLGCEWHAIFVETPEYVKWPELDRKRVWETLGLAGELGAETASIGGGETGALFEYARKHNVTKLIIGKPAHPTWRDRLLGSRLDEIVRASGDIDVYVITGDAPGGTDRPATRWPGGSPSRAHTLALAAAAVAACTLVAVALRTLLGTANLLMLYLAVVVGIAVRLGRGASVLASVLAVAAFDLFCVPPYGTFAVADTQYLPVFAVMLVVALLISGLAARLHDQGDASRAREQRTAALLAASRELVGVEDPARVAEIATRHVGETFDARVRLYAPDPLGRLRPLRGEGDLDAREAAVAGWALEHGKPAGPATGTLPEARALWIPLAAGSRPLALLAVEARDPTTFRNPERMELLGTFAGQIAAALERARLTAESRRTEQLVEINRLKSEFVAVAAHELRTPLDTLRLAVERIAERVRGAAPRDVGTVELLDTAKEHAARLGHLVDDLLDLSRLESRQMVLQISECRPSDLVREAVDRVIRGARIGPGRVIGPAVVTDVTDDLPTVRADADEVGRALGRFLENAIRHAGPGGQVVVGAEELPDFVQIFVADNGPGLPVAEQARIFEPFMGDTAGGGRTGLGLAIVRGIIRAHGGDIWVDSGPGPGAVFNFTLPRADLYEPRTSGDQTPGTAAGSA